MASTSMKREIDQLYSRSPEFVEILAPWARTLGSDVESTDEGLRRLAQAATIWSYYIESSNLLDALEAGSS